MVSTLFKLKFTTANIDHGNYRLLLARRCLFYYIFKIIYNQILYLPFLKPTTKNLPNYSKEHYKNHIFKVKKRLKVHKTSLSFAKNSHRPSFKVLLN